jgi:hypothetical protein
MANILQLFLISCGLIFCVIVINLIMKNKLNERTSVIWLSGSLLILLMAGQHKLLDTVAAYVDIAYPPSLLFLLSTLILLLTSLYQSIQISKLNGKIKDIAQYLALKGKQEDHKFGKDNGK